MPHNVSPDFIAASEAAVNDVTSTTLVGWLKSFNDTATFFELDVSQLDGTSFLKGSGDDVTFFDYYEYDDESDNVEAWEVTRTSSMYPYGVVMSQADVTLDNTSKRYLPGFDPTIGESIKPRRPLKIFSGLSGEEVQQFIGFSDIPKNNIMDRKTKLHAFDVMEYFDSVETEIKYFENEYWNDIIEALLIEQGFTSAQYNLDISSQNAIGYMPTSGMTVGEIFRKGCEAEQGLMFADENGVIQFWNRLHYGAPSDPSKSFSYLNLIDVEYVDTPIVNYVRVQALPRSVSALQKIWQNSQSIEVPAGEQVTVSINFEDEFGPLPVTSAHSPVYITAQDDLNKSYFVTNTASDGTGSANAADITMVSFDLVGDVAFIVFENTGIATMHVTDLHIYGTPAKVTSVIQEEYKDQTSIDAYGINPHNQGKVVEIKNDWIQSSGTAYAHAFNLVTEYADGQQQLVIKPFADPSLKFGDKVEIMVDDVDVAASPAIILGYKLKNSLSDILSQELTIDIREFPDYFMLDVSELDGVHVLAA